MKVLLHSDNAGTQSVRYRPPSNPCGLIDLGVQTAFASHRCGWSYALDALRPEHNDAGLLFDGFVDRTFNTQRGQPGREAPPYRRPWLGVIHAVGAVPAWFPKQAALQTIIASEHFQASLPHCRGLITLSEHCAALLRQRLPTPVASLSHPTEIPARIFDYAAFAANPQKKIVAIGWWLRRLMSIYQLPLDRRSPYRKWQLVHANAALKQTVRELARLEFVRTPTQRLQDKYRDNTEAVDYLANDAYDGLLAENIVFLHLHDANANNVVVECIARATPLLVNRLPAVVEYLGSDYPFYFATLEEAAAKAVDFALVRQTHEYLFHCPTRSKLSQEHFLNAFRASAVYPRKAA